MAGMLYGFPFNEELFSYMWKNEPDVVTTAMYDSGAVQQNAEIAAQIAQGSDTYTVPFYKTIGGEPANYDGKTDMPVVETEGGYQSGIVFGRMQGWKARDFVVDYHKGDPVGQIASQVANFWFKYYQAQTIKILNAVFGITAQGDYAQWADHVLDISSSSTTVAKENKVGETTFGDAAVKACGDIAKGAFGLAIMHSAVANHLDGLQLVEYAKYTDARGIERPLPIAYANGYTIVISDQVPYEAATGSSAPKYTSYILGTGAIQTADAPVKVPVELDRNPVKNGGEEMLYTRVRKTFLPNGFTYTKEATDSPSPTDEQLATSSRYKPIFNPKSIAMAKIVSNG